MHHHSMSLQNERHEGVGSDLTRGQSHAWSSSSAAVMWDLHNPGGVTQEQQCLLAPRPLGSESHLEKKQISELGISLKIKQVRKC